MLAVVRQTIRFTGHVQGVGFRASAVRLAEGLRLDGTVRNVADGSVELVVSGAAARIRELVDRLQERFGQADAPAEVIVEEPLAEAGAGVRIIR